MIPLVAIGVCGIVLLVLYMRKPPISRLRISAARFLLGSDLRKHQPKRLSVTAPMRRWRFWVRMAMLALLATALWTVSLPTHFPPYARIGLLVVVDTSYSMTTRSSDGSRFDEALALLSRLQDAADALAGKVPVCTITYAADTRARWIGDLAGALTQLSEIGPSARGGTAAILRKMAHFEPNTCRPTQVVVVTDLPKPAMDRSDSDGAPVAWLRVGQPKPNASVLHVSADTGGLVRRPQRIHVDVASDPPLRETRVSVIGPDGETLTTDEVETDAEDVRRLAFAPDVAGTYYVTLSDGGAYAGDDRVRVRLEFGGRLRVAWQVPTSMPNLPGWEESQVGAPDLLVAPLSASGSAPLSLRTVGAYRPEAGARVGFFIEEHPLIDGVSLDVFEHHAPQPVNDLPEGYKAVLTAMDGAPWIAVREQPRSVIVPDLATSGSESVRNLSTTVFFNALRWLMHRETRLLESAWLTPEGEVIEDGRNEATPAAKEATTEPPPINPVWRSGQRKEPLWPWLVLAAILMALIERALTLWHRGWA